MIDFQKVVAAIQLAGSATPAFAALVDAVKTAFSEPQQDALKAELAAANARADAAHGNAQDAAKGR